MLSRVQGSRRCAQKRKSKLLAGAAKPVLENLERRSMLSAGTPDPSFSTDGLVTESFGLSAANASATVPGLADALQVKNDQLEMVLAQLEKNW